MRKVDKSKWFKPYTSEEDVIKKLKEEIKKNKLEGVRALRGRVMALPMPVWPVTAHKNKIIYKEVEDKSKGSGRFYISSESGIIICGENTMDMHHLPSSKDLADKFEFLDFPENPLKFYVVSSDNDKVNDGDVLFIRPDVLLNKITPINVNNYTVFFLDPEWFHSIKKK